MVWDQIRLEDDGRFAEQERRHMLGLPARGLTHEVVDRQIAQAPPITQRRVSVAPAVRTVSSIVEARSLFGEDGFIRVMTGGVVRFRGNVEGEWDQSDGPDTPIE